LPTHRLDEHLSNIDLDRAEPRLQRGDRPIEVGGIDTDGEEGAGGGRFGEPVAGRAVGVQGPVERGE
jgi:hypothetical protein